MSKLWRIHLFAGYKDEAKKLEARTYCIKNKIMAIGWSCKIMHDSIQEYKEKFKEHNPTWMKKNGNYPDSVNRIIEQVQEGDYVWTYDGIEHYWIGKVIDKYPHIPVYHDNDIFFKEFGVYREVENWYSCEDDEVPGKVINSFIKGSTLQPIKTLLEYSEYLYQKKHKNQPNLPFHPNEDVFETIKNLLHYNDLEDLLGLWLQIDRNYVVFPSTNKQSTKDYEYILKKEDGSKKAIIQCKTGYDCINLETFDKYKDKYEIYLSVIDGHLRRNKKEVNINDENIININDYNTEYPEKSGYQIYKVSLKYLLDWAKKNKNILPDRIRYYLDITGY